MISPLWAQRNSYPDPWSCFFSRVKTLRLMFIMLFPIFCSSKHAHLSSHLRNHLCFRLFFSPKLTDCLGTVCSCLYSCNQIKILLPLAFLSSSLCAPSSKIPALLSFFSPVKFPLRNTLSHHQTRFPVLQALKSKRCQTCGYPPRQGSCVMSSLSRGCVVISVLPS